MHQKIETDWDANSKDSSDNPLGNWSMHPLNRIYSLDAIGGAESHPDNEEKDTHKVKSLI